MDVGCGSGILSAFAVRAGAKTVTGIDKAKVRKLMKAKLTELNVKDIIFINKSVEELVESGKNVKKYDVIVSEWMGYFLLFENMIASIYYARKHLLTDRGTMIPSRANMYLTIAGYPIGAEIPR